MQVPNGMRDCVCLQWRYTVLWWPCIVWNIKQYLHGKVKNTLPSLRLENHAALINGEIRKENIIFFQNRDTAPSKILRLDSTM